MVAAAHACHGCCVCLMTPWVYGDACVCLGVMPGRAWAKKEPTQVHVASAGPFWVPWLMGFRPC